MRWLAVCIAAFAGVLVTVSLAQAHAEPAIVKPGDGAVLAAGPSMIEIRMTQEMARQAGANDIDVFDSSGKEVTSIAAVLAADRVTLSVSIVQQLGPGTYTVEWKTLSAEDGDTANGSYTFSIDPAATPQAGNENLKELPSTPVPEPSANVPSGTSGQVTPPDLPGSNNGRSWVLVIAVGIVAFAFGGGLTYLLVQKTE